MTPSRQIGAMSRPADAAPRLGVLPFSAECLTGESALLVDGLSRDLRDAFARIEGLTVAGLASATYLQNKHLAPGAIRERPGVAVILRGTVTMAGEDLGDEDVRGEGLGSADLGIELRLVDAENGSLLWSSSSEMAPDRLLDLRRNIMKGVTGAVGVRPPASKPSDVITGTLYLDYLTARALLARGRS